MASLNTNTPHTEVRRHGAPALRASVPPYESFFGFPMRRAKALPLLLLLLLPLRSQAQLLDSISLFLQEPPRFTAAVDARGSFISNRNVRLLGLKIGLEHAGRVRYGIGYSFLLTPVERERDVEGLGTVNTRLRLGYFTPYFTYAFYQRGHWEVSIPVQLGIGGGSLVYTAADGRKRKLKEAFLFLYEPAMAVQYRFLKYFAVHGGWGFRLALANAELDENINAPIYLFGLKVFAGDLWKGVRGEE